MTYDHHNLVRHTVEAKPVYMTPRCAVGSKPSPWSGYLHWNEYHRWGDHAGGLKGGVCANCGKTLKQLRVRVNPKTGEPVRKVTRVAPEPQFKWTEDGRRATR